MATKVFFPRLGESITEAVVSRWLKKPGDNVTRGEVLAELETSKAMMELESPIKGTLLAILFQEGETVHLNDLIAVVGFPGEAWDNGEKTKEVLSKIKTTSKTNIINVKESINKTKPISPNARRRIRELGINLNDVKNIKKSGRITAEDIERFEKELKNEIDNDRYIRLPLNNIQKITANRMVMSAKNIPQFSISIDCQGDALLKFIKDRKENEINNLTITAVLIWLTAKALQNHPKMNSKFDGDSVIQFKKINISVAVSTPEGLFVPVIHSANLLSLQEISTQLGELKEKVKVNRLNLSDTQDGTFTISNLGMKGVNSFVPLVDPNQSAILAIGSIRDGFIWGENGKILKVDLINLSVSADHRVIGGAEASEFLLEVKEMIEKL